jgi:hypothetical protein
MAFTRLENDIANISKLSDRPNQNDGLSAAQLKGRFDKAGIDIKDFINETLIPALESLNLSEVPHSTDILGLRVNADSMIEVTLDGENWQTTGSRGHTILDKNNNILPQRATLKFTNSTVTDDGEVTIVEGVKGDKGESLQFVWDGTRLGIKREDELVYSYSNLEGPQGPQGPEGPQGPPGIIETYIHNQISSASTWSIQHNLGRYPSVSIVDSGGSIVLGAVKYISENEIQISFSAAFAGRAFLN